MRWSQKAQFEAQILHSCWWEKLPEAQLPQDYKDPQMGPERSTASLLPFSQPWQWLPSTYHLAVLVHLNSIHQYNAFSLRTGS